MTTSVVCNRRLSTGRRGGQLQLASAPYRQSISCHFLGGMRWLATFSWCAQISQFGQICVRPRGKRGSNSNLGHCRDGYATCEASYSPTLAENLSRYPSSSTPSRRHFLEKGSIGNTTVSLSGRVRV